MAAPANPLLARLDALQAECVALEKQWKQIGGSAARLESRLEKLAEKLTKRAQKPDTFQTKLERLTLRCSQAAEPIERFAQHVQECSRQLAPELAETVAGAGLPSTNGTTPLAAEDDGPKPPENEMVAETNRRNVDEPASEEPPQMPSEAEVSTTAGSAAAATLDVENREENQRGPAELWLPGFGP